MNIFTRFLDKVAYRLIEFKPYKQYSKIEIKEDESHEAEILRNQIWYRGDPSELSQYFSKFAKYKKNATFWSISPSTNHPYRKIHAGLPQLIVDILVKIVYPDLNKCEFENETYQKMWEEISKENDFKMLFKESLTQTLELGDGAFKISFDTELSNLPIIEFYGADRVTYEYNRNRLTAIIFHTDIAKGKDTYCLHEVYRKKTIDYELYDKRGEKIALADLEETKDLVPVEWDEDIMLAVKSQIYQHPKYRDRGKSILYKSDTFDALDEIISQWLDGIRKGKIKQYIPQEMIPKDPVTGQVLEINPLDNDYYLISASGKETQKEMIDVIQPNVNMNALIDSYANALDLCLQGIVSPSTLGIDLKKRDNAEAQREKEKTTLYTRGDIVESFSEILTELLSVALKSSFILNNQSVPKDIEPTVSFGEYAKPTFDSVIATVSTAVNNRIMSINKAIDEMYGDTMEDDEKATELLLIMNQNGMLVEEPNQGDDVTEDEDKVIDDEEEQEE
ncbi:capsid protein [Anaerorhabdus sp.]|uniref:capsid protein n=1 Tax=Anaerorhabdus sp. TaxID=1872524 RepID=UPI002FC93F2A